MNIIFKTQPGFFSVYSKKGDPDIPPGKVRLFMASIQVMDIGEEIDMSTEFSIFAGMQRDMTPEQRRLFCKAVLDLAHHIEENKDHFGV